MITDYENKYMQVFQNYDEFGEHSADYVQGEDHVAYLILENEVIYWLYLEQVWRPLNVRTTKTGELEDGRTKVAVKLEYVEGGLKYTNVPNIPDPERITSMAYFLKDYPDIEEVNVSGTVNLTDLSYAFAGSKIKDFSMLDTSNVTLINHFLCNVNNKDAVYEFTTKADNLDVYNCIDNSNFDTIVINGNNIGNYNNYIYASCNVKNIYFNINGKINIGGLHNNKTLEYIKCDVLEFKQSFASIEKEFTIEANSVYIQQNNTYGSDYNIGTTINFITDRITFSKNNSANKIFYKWILNKFTNIELPTRYGKYIYKFVFGYGIKGNYNIKVIDSTINAYIIGNFWFTTPIVDDNFYVDKQCLTSIFQYKTTFEEVADVHITEATDSSLIYADWSSIDFDTSNMNIEIHNKVDINNNSLRTFNSIKIDNRNINIEEYYNYPGLGGVNYINTNDINSYIKGKYKINGSSMFDSILFKDIDIYVTGVSENVNIITIYIKDNLDFIDRKINLINKNIVLDLHQNPTPINNNYNINGLINDNILKCGIYMTNYTANSNFIIAYINNIDLNICGGLLVPWYNYLLNSSIDKPIIISSTVNVGHYLYTDTIDNVYLNCEDEGIIYNIISKDAENTTNYKPFAKNIYGVINLNLLMDNEVYNGLEEIKHIDINYTTCNGINTNQYNISSLIGCDNETTINLITKLVNNTSDSTKTIYMYRSQSNIIGDDNIAAAVAKNYEFAIIEN